MAHDKLTKAIALSQISIMVLEIFSFAFIMAMVFSGVGVVSAKIGDQDVVDYYEYDNAIYGYQGTTAVNKWQNGAFGWRWLYKGPVLVVTAIAETGKNVVAGTVETVSDTAVGIVEGTVEKVVIGGGGLVIDRGQALYSFTDKNLAGGTLPGAIPAYQSSADRAAIASSFPLDTDDRNYVPLTEQYTETFKAADGKTVNVVGWTAGVPQIEIEQFGRDSLVTDATTARTYYDELATIEAEKESNDDPISFTNGERLVTVDNQEFRVTPTITTINGQPQLDYQVVKTSGINYEMHPTDASSTDQRYNRAVEQAQIDTQKEIVATPTETTREQDEAKIKADTLADAGLSRTEANKIVGYDSAEITSGLLDKAEALDSTELTQAKEDTQKALSLTQQQLARAEADIGYFEVDNSAVQIEARNALIAKEAALKTQLAVYDAAEKQQTSTAKATDAKTAAAEVAAIQKDIAVNAPIQTGTTSLLAAIDNSDAADYNSHRLTTAEAAALNKAGYDNDGSSWRAGDKIDLGQMDDDTHLYADLTNQQTILKDEKTVNEKNLATAQKTAEKAKTEYTQAAEEAETAASKVLPPGSVLGTGRLGFGKGLEPTTFGDSFTDQADNTYTFKDGKWTGKDKDGNQITIPSDTINLLNKNLAEQYAQEKEFKVFGNVAPSSGAGFGWMGAHLVEGVVWAGAVWVFMQTIASILPDDKSKEFLKPLGQSLALGIITYKAIYGVLTADWGTKETITETVKGGEPVTKNVGSLMQETTATWTAGIIAAVITYRTFAKEYEKTKTKETTISFKCYQWQAPSGGDSCTKCNEDIQMPCSEYRCKSLGQTCKLLNAGTGSDMCIDGSRNDVTSPGIIPDENILTAGLSYAKVTNRPPGGAGPAGMTIIGSAADDCIPAFTPFEFGIVTTDTDGNQPAQCKIDYNHTNSFNDMNYYMSNNNLYVINHSQVMMLPGTDLLNTIYAEANGSLQVQNNGNYDLYIRCKDGNGNENKDEFVVSFCIDKTPDTVAPIIKATNINSGSGVKYQADNVSIEVYTDEPASCRWSRKDASYVNMEYNMTCTNQIWEVNAENLYTCTTTLTGIVDREDNDFYFRCKDLKDNTMQQSYPFTLRGSEPLTLLKVGPSGIVGGATSTVTATLEASTDNGLDNGRATCYYSTIPNSTGIEFVNTDAVTHTQPLDLTSGNYTYYITCIDGAGNSASNSTSFVVYVDKDSPIILRAFTYESRLTLVTNEESTCRYSNVDCNFNLGNLEGTAMPYDETKVHYSEFDTSKTYYVRCKDKYDNQPSSGQCSFIARPFSLTIASG